MRKIFLILSLLISGFCFGQNLHWDSTHYKYQNGVYGRGDSIIIIGHSIPAGTNGTCGCVQIDSAFATLYYRTLQDSGYNHAIGGSGAIDACMQLYRYASFPHHSTYFIMAGRNQYTSSTANQSYNTVINSYKAMWAAAHLAYYYSARSSPYVTKFGTWSNYPNVATSGYFETLTQEGIKTSTSGDSIQYVMQFNDSTCVVTVLGQTAGSGGAFTISVDHTIVVNATTDGANDGVNTKNININRSGTPVVPMSFFLTGLSYGIHTITVTNGAAKTLVVDYFGHLIDKRFTFPFFFMHDIAYGATGFGGTATDTLVHSNLKIDSLVNTLPVNYQTDTFPTNNWWTQATDIGTDGIHPNAQGHRHIDSGLVSWTLGLYAYPAKGTIMSAGGGFYTGIQTTPLHPFKLGRLITATEIRTQFLPLSFNWSMVILNAGRFNLTLNGVGATGGNGVGASLNAPDMAINDSSFCYFRVKPSGEGSVPMGIQGRDWTGGTYSLGIGSNSSNILAGINNTRQGGSIFFSSQNASGNPACLQFATKLPTSVSDTTALRMFADRSITVGDSVAAGNSKFYIVGKGAARMPLGATTDRPTGEGGAIRFNTDSTTIGGGVHMEAHNATKYQALAYLNDLPKTGQTTLVSGTKAITINGLSSSSIAIVTLVSQGGTVTTTSHYAAVCTANTLTISAVTNAGTNTVNTTDTSVINYMVVY